MPISAIFPQPGIFREGTQYAAEGRWYDSQWIRWRKGFPEAMGGWVGNAEVAYGMGLAQWIIARFTAQDFDLGYEDAPLWWADRITKAARLGHCHRGELPCRRDHAQALRG